MNKFRHGPMGSALYSECEKYRYMLNRTLTHAQSSTSSILFILLNPSTATEEVNDPTITRCMGYARRWGYDHLVICNIFALRSTDPRLLYSANDPIGPFNDRTILFEAQRATRVICGWGTHGAYLHRGEVVLDFLKREKIELFCLRKTQEGFPGHPLYLKSTLEPQAL